MNFVFSSGYRFALCLGTSLAISDAGAAAFQNLNFESATIQAAPVNYVPWDAQSPLSASAALPFWTVREDTTNATAVWGTGALDETSVLLLRAGVGDGPIQGNYSVQLYSVMEAPPEYFHTVSISQTGDVVAGTHSISFLWRSPSVAGGVIPGVPTVTLNGQAINIFAQSTNGSIVTMVGDVTAFAGLTVDLTIRSAGITGQGLFYSENVFDLDAISFSPAIVPEPSSLGLILLSGVACWWCGCRRRQG